MSFFQYTPSSASAPESWDVSRRFWLYWAIVVPLTFIILGTYVVFQRSIVDEAVGHLRAQSARHRPYHLRHRWPARRAWRAC
jgi:hypothetical protein